jgi:hypothetical protein
MEFSCPIKSDGWKYYDGLVDLWYKKHHRVQYDNDEFENRKSHFNGIQYFWSIAKIRLAKFRGLSICNLKSVSLNSLIGLKISTNYY